MVAIEEIADNNMDEEETPVVEEVSVSEERRLDAEAIEEAASKMTRVSARMHLESLAKRLRKESEALSRVEQSKRTKEQQDEQEQSVPPAAAAAPAASNQEQATEETSKSPSPAPAAPALSTSARYTPIDKFAFDAGGYDSAFVTLYVELKSVGSIPRDKITCQFTKDSFDLIVIMDESKSYRLFKDNLEKDIDPDKSKIVVKKDKILVKLHKVKTGEYGGYDYWSQLTDKKGKKKKENGGGKGGGGANSDNPQASIMQLMKDMYDDGDDNMKKMIGETMMKQQRGELGDGMGGMGGMGMDDL